MKHFSYARSVLLLAAWEFIWRSLVLFQRWWPAVDRTTDLHMNKKSSSLLRFENHMSDRKERTKVQVVLKCVVMYFLQVLLPLIDQYFKNHSLYFLSSATKTLSSSGYASNKEKEMVTRWNIRQHYCRNVKYIQFIFRFLLEFTSVFISSPASVFSLLRWFLTSSSSCLSVRLFMCVCVSLFCKLAALVRHRISLFGKMMIFRLSVFPLWCSWLCVCWRDVDVFFSRLCLLCFVGSDSTTMVSCLHILAHTLDTRYDDTRLSFALYQISLMSRRFIKEILSVFSW